MDEIQTLKRRAAFWASTVFWLLAAVSAVGDQWLVAAALAALALQTTNDEELLP